MPHRRVLAILALIILTSLSPAFARTRPARAERTAASPNLFSLLFDRLAQIRDKVLSGDMIDVGSGLDPDGAKNDSGSRLDPDGARTDTGPGLDPDGAK
jgi:hypothetical protein